jgi:hypothetical protein
LNYDAEEPGECRSPVTGDLCELTAQSKYGAPTGEFELAGSPFLAIEGDAMAYKIIACEVMKSELLAVKAGTDVDFVFVEMGLHLHPARLHEEL